MSLRIVVLGYVVRGPLGGMAWHHLQYVLGLYQLGHDVYFLEDSDDYPSCYDPVRHSTQKDPTYGLTFAGRAFSRLGLESRWAYYDAHTRRWHGPAEDRALEICRSAELLINVSGVNPLRNWHLEVQHRLLIDTDPVFTQIRHLTDETARRSAAAHTAFFSFGENIASGTSAVPDDGFVWSATRQPIVLSAWPRTHPRGERFTTVMQWESYPAREFAGQRYGTKADSFWPYADLPRSTGASFEIALGSPSAPYAALAERGWALRDPLEITCDPWVYQSYLSGSRAEFSVSKHAYVASQCGWFSERSAAYLALGRPVVVQDTGFSRWLTAGEGVLAFNTPDEARARIAELSGAYGRHCGAARAVAEEFFDARRVLPALIERGTAKPQAGA